MPNWDELAAKANAAIFRVFGEVVSYSRPASQALDAIVAFELLAIPDTSPEYLAPDAKERAFTVKIADIALGPKRGDLIVFREERFQVSTIADSAVDGTAMIGARKLAVNA